MKKLNTKQLQTLPKDKYHDGNGLYISISKPGRGKWSFRYTINKKSREMGLGSYPDVSLADARQLSLNNKQLLSKKIDPIDEKNRVEVLRQQQNKKFSDIADLYIRTKKMPEWSNDKSYTSWKNTLNTYAAPILDSKPIVDINQDDIDEMNWKAGFEPIDSMTLAKAKKEQDILDSLEEKDNDN